MHRGGGIGLSNHCRFTILLVLTQYIVFLVLVIVADTRGKIQFSRNAVSRLSVKCNALPLPLVVLMVEKLMSGIPYKPASSP